YNNEGRLTAWQNKPSSPTSMDSFLYDGEGNCVALKLDGTITYYLGQYAEITGAIYTKYLQAGNGLPTVMSTDAGMARTLNYLPRARDEPPRNGITNSVTCKGARKAINSFPSIGHDINCRRGVALRVRAETDQAQTC